MVAKNMTTAKSVFDGAVGPAMILVTLDPKVVEAVDLVLKAISGEIIPADLIERVEPGQRIPIEGGVATLALEASGVGQTPESSDG